MNVQVLALFGSPRRGGNTDILIEELLSGISRDGGVDITRIYISDYDIKPCTGCGYCEKTGNCNIEDDMQRLYPLLEEAEIIVLSSPVYFYGLSAQSKALIDRCHVYWARKYVLGKPWSTDDGIIRQGFFVSSAGTHNPSLFYGGEMTVRFFYDCMDILYQGAVTVRGVQESGDVKKLSDILKIAYSKGVELISQR